MTEAEREQLLNGGAVTQAMVLHSESAAEFSEELANLYQPAPGSPEARRLAEVRGAGQLRHPDRIPKIQLPLSAGARVPVRYDAADRSRVPS